MPDLDPQHGPQDRNNDPMRTAADNEHIIQLCKLLVEHNNGATK